MAFYTFAPMSIAFYKYQGTGNDFVMIDNRLNEFDKNDTKLVAKLCDRKFGIGADGLILLEEHPSLDFWMIYYNADGNLSSMCGNGGRCITHFAKQLGLITNKAKFEAVDGMHIATIEDDVVSLQMNNVTNIDQFPDYTFLDTGSPHHVAMVNKLVDFDVKTEGESIRYGIYGDEGANVNFVEQLEKDIYAVRTYERGVEDETLSCGTGVTAVAIALYENGMTPSNEVLIRTQGGDLRVRFTKTAEVYENIYLIGPATQVFKGMWV